jgi:hypothetical protein
LDKTQIVRAWLYHQQPFFFSSIHSSGQTPFYPFLFFFVISRHRATTGRLSFLYHSFSSSSGWLFRVLVSGGFETAGAGLVWICAFDPEMVEAGWYGMDRMGEMEDKRGLGEERQKRRTYRTVPYCIIV